MASSSKQRTTMAKRNRENAVRERRAKKQLKKEARKQAAAEGNAPEPSHFLAGEQGPTSAAD
jgi:hypothetical protein